MMDSLIGAIIFLSIMFGMGFLLGHLVGSRENKIISDKLTQAEETLTLLDGKVRLMQNKISIHEEEELPELRPEHQRFISGLNDQNEEIQIDVTPHGYQSEREYKEA